MIQTHNDLCFYIAADRIMNGHPPKKTIKEAMLIVVNPFTIGNVIIRYLRALRKYEYYKNNQNHTLSFNSIGLLFWHRRWCKLALRTGFSIGPNALGYGVVIPHHGTIVVNSEARIGNFAVLHTCTCVAGGDKKVGDFFYFSTGSQLVGEFNLGDNVTVAAHSLVNNSFGDNVLLAGCPSTVKKENYSPWYVRDGRRFIERVEQVKKLKNKYNIK